MDFARKQLEKYGWTDGKGLGKHENGISEALKPKLKRSVAGVGHDMASDFTEHWWSALYDKAAGNVQVEEKHGKMKKIKTKDKQFKITNSTWHLKKKQNDSNEEEYGDYFVKTAVLANGGSKTEKLRESESEDEEQIEKDKKDAFKMTDEELFAACEGRTAHKGARHGLGALGKLARIERQEQMLLTQPQFNGYSHAEKIKKEKLSINDLQVVEDMNLNSDGDSTVSKKKKKKKKNCLTNDEKVNSDHLKMEINESCDIESAESLQPIFELTENLEENGSSMKNDDTTFKKSKKSKRKYEKQCCDETPVESKTKSKKKKKRRTDFDNNIDNNDESRMNAEPITVDMKPALEKVKKSKKKKLE